MRLLAVIVASALAVLAGIGASTAAGAPKPVRATFVGDSVAASVLYSSVAQAQLRKGLKVTLDLRVCRRLVQPSCTYQGSTPSTALEAVQGYGRSLGDVLIVKVGYNESAHGYGDGIDRIMRAALRQGANGVVWLTLRETSSTYRWTNIAIRKAAKRWPQLTVADWHRHSQGKPWFGGDGLHLTAQGATALANFVRPLALKAAKPTR